MEKSPSWSRAHDWKSCRPLKGLEGSNPSFSATSEQASLSLALTYFISQSALAPLRLLSKSRLLSGRRWMVAPDS